MPRQHHPLLLVGTRPAPNVGRVAMGCPDEAAVWGTLTSLGPMLPGWWWHVEVTGAAH